MVRLPLFQSRASRPLWPGFNADCLVGQFLVQGAVAFADHLDPPLEYVANGGLAGLDAVEPGKDRTLHDAADARNVRHVLLGGDHAAIASGGPDDLDKGALSHTASDGAVMDVHLADGNRNARRQAKLLAHFGLSFPADSLAS